MHKIVYSFKKESVTIEYNKQLICYHSYNMNEKGIFRRFKQTLETTQPQDIVTVMSLASRNNIRAQQGHRPVVQKIIF